MFYELPYIDRILFRKCMLFLPFYFVGGILVIWDLLTGQALSYPINTAGVIIFMIAFYGFFTFNEKNRVKDKFAWAHWQKFDEKVLRSIGPFLVFTKGFWGIWIWIGWANHIGSFFFALVTSFFLVFIPWYVREYYANKWKKRRLTTVTTNRGLYRGATIKTFVDSTKHTGDDRRR